MSVMQAVPNRKVIANWPSARLIELAESHSDDTDLLEFICSELGRRDAEVAHEASRRVREMLGRQRQGGKQQGPSPAADAHQDEAAAARIAALEARLHHAEQRAREAEQRAIAAERALAAESLPPRGLPLLRRVYLTETAPPWLVDQVRRAFRLRFHPDRFTEPELKARAEATFKDAEEVFRQITANSG